MKTAVKYIYEANPFYVHLKKHYCPKCTKKVVVRYKSEIVNSKSPHAHNYDFSLGDTFLIGDVEFRTPHFFCPNCHHTLSFLEMKKIEKHSRKK